MGLAHLTRVTIISPRSEYEDVAKALAQFEDFHPVGTPGANFDSGVQELTVKAVRLFAQADQAVKDLGLKLMPGQIDIVFRGVKVQQSDFEAGTWEELLTKAETQLAPIAEHVRMRKVSLQKALKDETDAENLIGALEVVSGFSSDLGGLSDLSIFKAVITVVMNERVSEFGNALPDAILLSQPITKEQALVLVAVPRAEEGKLDKAMKLLELKPLAFLPGTPQNPAEAYRRAMNDHHAAVTAKEKVESEMDQIKVKDGTALLAVRELAEVARRMLDEARVSGSLKRLATISGYIPAKKEAKMGELFGRWMVHHEDVGAKEEEFQVPTLMENRAGISIFQPITKEQGIPGGREVDPTPIVSFVFPVFFGMMFGDVGHGIILTLFALLVRQRGTGSMRQWGNIFLIAGISATVFGALVGEFFGSALNAYQVLSPLLVHQIEILQHPLGVDAPNPEGIQTVMLIAILIGIAHLTTALSLDVYQTIRAKENVELLVEKVPTLTMYVSGVGYGIAFMGTAAAGAGYSFNVLKEAGMDPLLHAIPNNLLGGVSMAILLPSMLVLFCGKAIAIKMGKLKGETVGVALSNGGLEVFERITQFLSNTVSYVRLAIMLLVHAVLLLIVNKYFPLDNPLMIAPWVIFNCIIIAFEAFIVYVQDLRLHLYEFFTKFFIGTGTPFRKILPDRARIRIKWL